MMAIRCLRVPYVQRGRYRWSDLYGCVGDDAAQSLNFGSRWCCGDEVGDDDERVVGRLMTSSAVASSSAVQ